MWEACDYSQKPHWNRLQHHFPTPGASAYVISPNPTREEGKVCQSLPASGFMRLPAPEKQRDGAQQAMVGYQGAAHRQGRFPDLRFWSCEALFAVWILQRCWHTCIHTQSRSKPSSHFKTARVKNLQESSGNFCTSPLLCGKRVHCLTGWTVGTGHTEVSEEIS